jgi:hypothetical protein
MKVAKLLIIDEITMLKGAGLDLLSRSLYDLLQCIDAPFGDLVHLSQWVVTFVRCFLYYY